MNRRMTINEYFRIIGPILRLGGDHQTARRQNRLPIGIGLIQLRKGGFRVPEQLEPRSSRCHRAWP